jgi:cytochrome c oxidase cbb3-type subunit 3
VIASLAAACQGGGEVRERTAEDHDNNAQAGQVTGSAAPGEEDATLIGVAWQQNCARCHGRGGRGDGPEGPMYRPADLTRAAFQDQATDEDIKAVILKGRNKMPKFDHLPPKIVDGLVRHVRRLGGR